MTPRRFLFTAAVAGGLLLQSVAALVVFLIIAWVVCAYLWPFAPCFNCRGRKTNRGSTKGRFGKCRLCGGSGQRQVLGSKQLHKAIRSAVKYNSQRKGN